MRGPPRHEGRWVGRELGAMVDVGPRGIWMGVFDSGIWNFLTAVSTIKCGRGGVTGIECIETLISFLWSRSLIHFLLTAL